jgi:hypothetical protein
VLYWSNGFARTATEKRGLLVGVSPQPRVAQTAKGVGHNPHALALVGSAGVGSPQHTPARIEPQRGQVSENASEPASSESWGVLHERVPWSYLANDASELRPEPGALAVETGTLAGGTDVLAREAAADDIDVPTPGPAVEGADVVPDRERLEQSVALAGEQHASAVGINLDSADGAPAQQAPSQDAATCPCK